MRVVPAGAIRISPWSPRASSSAAAGRVFLDGEEVEGDPFTLLAREIATLPRPQEDWPRALRTGAVGHLGYELGNHLERLPTPHPDDERVTGPVRGVL